MTAGERRRPRHRRHERRGRGPHRPAAGPLSRMAHGARGIPTVHPRPLVRLSWTNKIGPLRVLPTSTKEHLMAVTLYSGFVPVCVQLLTGLKTVLKKAEEHATTQKWDTAVVLNLRFYPDMFPLERQVRQVCNHALGAARVAGVGLPSLPDQDNSFAEIQSRIDKVIDCLKGLRPDQIDGKDDAKVTAPSAGSRRNCRVRTTSTTSRYCRCSFTRRRPTTSCAAPASTSESATTSARARRKIPSGCCPSPRPLSARGERVDRAARRVRASAPANLARCRAPWSPSQRRRGGSFNRPIIAQASQLRMLGTVAAGNAGRQPLPPHPPAQRTQPVPLVPHAGVRSGRAPLQTGGLLG